MIFLLLPCKHFRSKWFSTLVNNFRIVTASFCTKISNLQFISRSQVSSWECKLQNLFRSKLRRLVCIACGWTGQPLLCLSVGWIEHEGVKAQLVSGCIRWSQVIPGGIRWSLVVPGGQVMSDLAQGGQVMWHLIPGCEVRSDLAPDGQVKSDLAPGGRGRLHLSPLAVPLQLVYAPETENNKNLMLINAIEQ